MSDNMYSVMSDLAAEDTCPGALPSSHFLLKMLALEWVLVTS